MYKVVLAIALFVVIISIGIAEQVFIKNTFDYLGETSGEIQRLLLSSDYQTALDKTYALNEYWLKKRDILEFLCPNTDIKDVEKEIGELLGSQIASMYDDSITRCQVIIAMADNSKNLLAYKWKNVL